MTNILINLPMGFFEQAELAPLFDRIRAIGDIRTTSHNSADEIRSDLAWADAVLMWSWPRFTDELLDAAPNLRYAGQIDATQRGARVALAHGLPVSLGRSGFSPAVAEFALTLILTTLRKTSDYHRQMRAGEEAWVRSFPDEIDPLERELTGRSVGIVGLGGVGRRLAELLAPFHCDLRIVDPFVPENVVQSVKGERTDLATMLQNSDVIVLCAAANEGSRYLLGAEEIALLRPGAVFVNVARALLVDTSALVERLKGGDIFAALDVFDNEPLEIDSPLRSLPNVYLTPHRAGGVIPSVIRVLTNLVEDLEAIMAGRERRYVLTESMLGNLDM